MQGSTKRKISVQASLSIKQDPNSKIASAKELTEWLE
jgi:hypothetical protein